MSEDSKRQCGEHSINPYGYASLDLGFVYKEEERLQRWKSPRNLCISTKADSLSSSYGANLVRTDLAIQWWTVMSNIFVKTLVFHAFGLWIVELYDAYQFLVSDLFKSFMYLSFAYWTRIHCFVRIKTKIL